MSIIKFTDLDSFSFQIENLNLDIILIYDDEIQFTDIQTELSKMYSHFEDLNLGFIKYSNNVETINKLYSIERHKFILLTNNVFPLAEVLGFIYDKTASFSNNLKNSIQLPSISQLGFQRQFCSYDEIKDVEQKAKFAFSLGLIEYNEDIVETELRSIDNAIVNLNVCKKGFVPSVNDAYVTGLTPEKLIQLIRYCTNSPSFKSIVFDMSNVDAKSNIDAIQLISLCIWYIIEGIDDGPLEITSEFSEYFVCSLSDYDEDLHVVNTNGKFWASISAEIEDYHAITFEEFNDINLGIVSDRLKLKFFK